MCTPGFWARQACRQSVQSNYFRRQQSAPQQPAGSRPSHLKAVTVTVTWFRTWPDHPVRSQHGSWGPRNQSTFGVPSKVVDNKKHRQSSLPLVCSTAPASLLHAVWRGQADTQVVPPLHAAAPAPPSGSCRWVVGLRVVVNQCNIAEGRAE